MLGGQPSHGSQLCFSLLLHAGGSGFGLCVLLLCSILCAVGSLTLLCLLFVSWFVCSGRWCIDGLGVFRVGQASVCLGPHLDVGLGLARCEAS